MTAGGGHSMRPARASGEIVACRSRIVVGSVLFAAAAWCLCFWLSDLTAIKDHI